MSDMSDAARALTAEERRERRRQRILADSSTRINRILSGPNGDENRVAPVLEGGEGFKLALAGESAPAIAGGEQAGDAQMPQLAGMPSMGNMPFDIQALLAQAAAAGAGADQGSPSLEDMGIQQEPSKLFNFVNSSRFQIVFVIGLLFRVLFEWGVVPSVLLPWTILFLTFEIVANPKTKTMFPAHGYAVNSLLWMGVNEGLVVNMGFVMEFVSKYINDSITVASGFLMSHMGFIAIREGTLMLHHFSQ